MVVVRKCCYIIILLVHRIHTSITTNREHTTVLLALFSKLGHLVMRPAVFQLHTPSPSLSSHLNQISITEKWQLLRHLRVRGQSAFWINCDFAVKGQSTGFCRKKSHKRSNLVSLIPYSVQCAFPWWWCWWFEYKHSNLPCISLLSPSALLVAGACVCCSHCYRGPNTEL